MVVGTMGFRVATLYPELHRSPSLCLLMNHTGVDEDLITTSLLLEDLISVDEDLNKLGM